MNHHQFYYITIATRPHPVLERLKEQVKSNGESIIVLGENENRAIGWQSKQNFGVKLREVYDFLQRPELNTNDIVLFTDAYDVAYCGERDDIIRRYYTFIKPIIFGAERQCNPDPHRAAEYTTQTNTEFPYLNSGLFIGRVWALRQCMANYKYNDADDDQRFWTTQFFTKPDLIELDYQNQLFLNIVDIDMRLLTISNNTAWYKSSNPLFVHDNGPVKNLIK